MNQAASDLFRLFNGLARCFSAAAYWCELQANMVLTPAPQPTLLTHEVFTMGTVEKIRDSYASPMINPLDPTQADTAAYIASVTVNGKEISATEYPIGTDTDPYLYDQGDEVEVKFALVDDAKPANTGPFGKPLQYIATDDVPPSAPGEPAVAGHEVIQVDEP